MKRIVKYAVALFTLGPLVMVSGGCAKHYLVLGAPPGVMKASISAPDSSWGPRTARNITNMPGFYGGLAWRITAKHRKAGLFDLGTLLVQAPGYMPLKYNPEPITLDKEFWRSGVSFAGDIRHKFVYPDSIRLERDPDFPGFRNELELTVNSEPPGARLYWGDHFQGVTPTQIKCSLDSGAYRRGFIGSFQLTLVQDGYQVETFYHREELPAWLKYEEGATLTREKLVILKRDPDAPQRMYVAPAALPSGQPAASSTPSPDRSSAYAAAKEEYDQALSEWESARAAYDAAVRNRRILAEKSDSDMLKLVAEVNETNTKRTLDVAQEKLNRARAKLEALERK